MHKTFSSSIEIFCFVCFWCPIVYTYKFWKRSSETIFSLWDNFGTLYNEVVTSPFVLFKFYLDVIDRLIFNFCDKNSFQALFSKTRFGRSRIKVINRVKENIFFFACKLIKRLVAATCQTVEPITIYDVYKNYKIISLVLIIIALIYR